jgi:hypothetical protein
MFLTEARRHGRYGVSNAAPIPLPPAPANGARLWLDAGSVESQHLSLGRLSESYVPCSASPCQFLSVGLIAPDFASCVQDRKLVISFGTMSVSRTL